MTEIIGLALLVSGATVLVGLGLAMHDNGAPLSAYVITYGFISFVAAAATACA